MSSSPCLSVQHLCSYTQTHLEVVPSCWTQGSDGSCLCRVSVWGCEPLLKLTYPEQNSCELLKTTLLVVFCRFNKHTSTSEPLHLLVSLTRTLSPQARSTWMVLWSPSALCLDLTFPDQPLSNLTAYHHLLALACSPSFPLPCFLFSKAFFLVFREEEQRVFLDSQNAARRAFTVRKTITKGINEMTVSREDGQHILRSCKDQMA